MEGRPRRLGPAAIRAPRAIGKLGASSFRTKTRRHEGFYWVGSVHDRAQNADFGEVGKWFLAGAITKPHGRAPRRV